MSQLDQTVPQVLRPGDLDNIRGEPSNDAQMMEFLAAELRVALHNLRRRGSLVDGDRVTQALATYRWYRDGMPVKAC